ncbi:hypothetical protein NDN08_007052 [Rhodosorus marinus]|uniref:Uncharacterized protein n=1 Tax=Rhodosorus marinus TaxID=101924 RepID=A0AAV8UFF3_9RHOD|nr:hypothetical protein NDN08_007052 [Rhodosorus marinus]
MDPREAEFKVLSGYHEYLLLWKKNIGNRQSPCRDLVVRKAENCSWRVELFGLEDASALLPLGGRTRNVKNCPPTLNDIKVYFGGI